MKNDCAVADVLHDSLCGETPEEFMFWYSEDWARLHYSIGGEYETCDLCGDDDYSDDYADSDSDDYADSDSDDIYKKWEV